MSDFNLLSEVHKEALLSIARDLIWDADFCVVYENSDLQWEAEELQVQAHRYLQTQISVSRDDK